MCNKKHKNNKNRDKKMLTLIKFVILLNHKFN